MMWGVVPAAGIGSRILWQQRGQQDEYLGTLLNRYIETGGPVAGVRAGTDYVDVGTLHGYREALQLLNEPEHSSPAALGPLGAAAILDSPDFG